VAARHGAAIDRPGGDAIAVVDLLELDSAFGQRPLDGPGVGDRVVGVGVQRLDHRPYAAWRDTRRDEGVRVVERQQAGLDADASYSEQLAELEDPLLALVGRHEVWELCPGGDEFASPLGVGLDGRRGAERYGNSGARGADGA